jgi:predicted MFS family arabinose efflux permease
MSDNTRHAIAVALGSSIALAVAMGIGRFVYTPILPFMIEGLGLAKSQAGLIASANFLGYLLGAFAAAAPLPGGRRRWFVGALAASALSTGAMGLVASLPAFLALRFAGGVASAFVLILASALVLDHLARLERPGLAAVHFAGVGSGIALSSVLVSAMAAQGFGWPALWLASGVLSLLAWAIAARLTPAEPAAPDRVRTTTQAPIDPRLVRLIIAYGLFGFGYVITATFISAMARESAALRGIEPVVWLAVGLAAIPSVALWTAIARRLGNERSYALACLVQAAGVAASAVASVPAILLAALLLGGTIMGITALGLVSARQLTSGDPRRALAFMTASFGLGQMIGPSFAGFAYNLGDSFLVPSLTAALALVAAAGLVAAPRSRQERGC